MSSGSHFPVSLKFSWELFLLSSTGTDYNHYNIGAIGYVQDFWILSFIKSIIDWFVQFNLTSKSSSQKYTVNWQHTMKWRKHIKEKKIWGRDGERSREEVNLWEVYEFKSVQNLSSVPIPKLRNNYGNITTPFTVHFYYDTIKWAVFICYEMIDYNSTTSAYRLKDHENLDNKECYKEE